MKRFLTSIMLLLGMSGTIAATSSRTHQANTTHQLIVNDTIPSAHTAAENKDSVVTLQEVEVAASTPQVKTRGEISTIKVRGTILSHLGNAFSVLAQTPGLHQGASGIEVNGLGTPVFLLNGREIDPAKVLDLLQANTIKEIRINRAPEIAYSSDGKPTVEIILFRPLDDFISLAMGDRMAIGRKYSNAGNLSFGIGLKKISSTIDYLGGVGNTENRETYFRKIYRSEGISAFYQHRSATLKELPQRLRWSLDYNINKFNRIGVEYYYQYSKKETHAEGSDSYRHTGLTEEADFRRHKGGISNLHNLSLHYNYKKRKRSFQIVQDLGFTNAHNNIDSKEGMAQSSTLSRARNRYAIAVTDMKFSTQLPLNIKLSTGLKYRYISNRSRSLLHQEAYYGNDYSLASQITEHDPQAFLSLSRKVGNVTLNVGGRYRYMYREISSARRGNEPANHTDGISSFFPLVSLKYMNGSGTSFFIRYNRVVEQPNFNSLNSGYVYMDSLTYTCGNPGLKAAFTNKLSAGVTFKDLSFSASYAHISDPIVNVSELREPDTDIVVEREINMKSDNRVRLSLAYSKTISRLNLYAEAEMVIPHAKYSFRGEVRTANKIAFNGNVNINYMINRFFGAYLSFDYQGHRTEITLTQKAVNNLSVGVMASLLKNRLTVNLALSDLLDGAHYNNLTYRYGAITNGTYGKNDIRGVMLKLDYTIFSKKIKTHATRGNEEETGRFY